MFPLQRSPRHALQPRLTRALVAALVLAACTTATPTPSPTLSPSPTVVEVVTAFEELVAARTFAGQAESRVEITVGGEQATLITAFVEFARRRGDYALMGVATVVTLDEKGVCRQARLVYLNAGEGPVNARLAAGLLHGETPSAQVIQAAAAMAADTEISPMGNVHASPEYQRHLARVLSKRALTQAFARAQSNGNYGNNHP